MSSLKVNQVKSKLLQIFEKHLDLTDLSTSDKDRETKIVTRCLAAFAVHVESGCSYKDAADAVWDGPDDNGIDAAFFDPSESRVVLVQAKWIKAGSGEPSAADVGTFLKGAKELIEHEVGDFDSRLQARLSDIGMRLSTPGTSVRLVLVSTGASVLAKHARSRIDKFMKELNGADPEPIASDQLLGLSEVYSGLAADPSQGGVVLDATLLDWAYVPAPFPAYFGLIDGAQLKSWWRNLGKRVVATNIRHSLGATDVNTEIRGTATNAPEKFWYFNNGITLVAEEAIKAPGSSASRATGVFSLRGASIVNGAQTVSSLAKVDDDAKLGAVRVPIRVILLKSAPAGFGLEVTRTNNLQNRVESRDFVAQEPEQKRLREEMAIEGIDYQYVRSEDTLPGPTSCDLIEMTTALACASASPQMAVTVKTGVGRLFADLKRAPYKTLFNPTLSGARAFNCVLAMREIDKWIERKKRLLEKKSGPTWGMLVHGNRILAAAVFRQLPADFLDQPIGTFQIAMDTKNLPQICERACDKAVACVKKKFPGRFLAVLFKNPTESKVVFDASSK